MVSKLMLWGGRNGAFRQPVLCCGDIDDIDTKLSKSKSHKRFKYLSTKKKKLLVQGYIRKYDPHKLCFIAGIIKICFQYYHITMDKWDLRNSSRYLLYTHSNSRIEPRVDIFSLNDDGLEHLECYTNLWKNAFGSTVVAKKKKQRWKLQISDAVTYYSIRIGVVDIDDVYDNSLLKDNEEQSALDRVSDKAFVMSCFTGYFWHKSIGKPYAKKCKDGSIIIMELDLSNKHKGGRLRYEVDGRKYGYATESINVSKKYVLAVSLVNNESVTILQDDRFN